jgi:hypothetical protein
MKRTIDDGMTGRRAGMHLSAAPSPRWLGAALIALGHSPPQRPSRRPGSKGASDIRSTQPIIGEQSSRF